MHSRLTRVLIAVLATTLLMAGSGGKGDYQNTTINPVEIYNAGKEALEEGRYGAAVRSLEVAAKHGIVLAHFELARLFSTGHGVPVDHGRAFKHYDAFAKQVQDYDHSHPAKELFAEAFVKAGEYYIAGVPEIHQPPRPDLGFTMLNYAASYFQDRVAQYKIAEFYLNGTIVQQDAQLGLKWLRNAVDKRYPPALALMGDHLWKGEIAPRAPATGLAYLAMAVEAAPSEENRWIRALYTSTLATADVKTIDAANNLLARFGVKFRIDAKRDLLDTVPGQQIAGPGAEKVIAGEAKTSGADKRPVENGVGFVLEGAKREPAGLGINSAPVEGR